MLQPHYALVAMICLALSSAAVAYPLPLDKKQWQLPRWATTVSVVNEGEGNRPCFKIVTPKRDWSQQIRTLFAYDADVARVVFSGRMRTANVTRGAAAIEKARAQLVFLDTAGDRVGHWTATTDRDGTTDWTYFRQEHRCSPGTRFVEIWLGMYLSTGTAWFDALDIVAYDAAGNELKPAARPATEATDTTGWRPFTPGDEDATRPLVLDFSSYLHAPAGKCGFVKTRGGHFVYENGERAKFWGIGYIKDWCPPKSNAPLIAERLARAGINLIRFHGMDAQDAKKTIFDAASERTDRLDADKLDRLDFLIAELKKRGIYANLNLLTKRKYVRGDGVVDFDKLPQGGKAASMFNRRLLELQKDYARLLLTHVNPYTGTAYKDEPAVAMLEIVNEASINTLEFLGGTPPAYEAELHQLFVAWCAQNNVPPPADHIKILIKKRDELANRFVEVLTRDYFTEMNVYLKDVLKVRQPISGTQFDWTLGEKRAQSNLDYLDQHGCWDHPAGGWDPMSIFVNKPMVKLQPGKQTLIEELVGGRIHGLPYTVSEWNCAWPNDFITEGPLLMAAYAGFNDWDAPMVFGTEGLRWQPAMTDTFSHESKPHFMAPFMTAAILFYRGDVAPGPLCAIDISGAKASLRVRERFTREQLLTQRCGLVTQPDPSIALTSPATTQPVTPTLAESYASQDGQIVWQSCGQFVLDTPRAQAVLGFTNAAAVRTADTRIKVDNPFAQVVVCSLTNAPLRSSPRLLITATARAENSGRTYRVFRKGLSTVGEGPILIESVNATIEICHDSAAKPVVYVVDWYGRRTPRTLPIEAVRGGVWRIRLGSEPAAWFEVIFE